MPNRSRRVIRPSNVQNQEKPRARSRIPSRFPNEGLCYFHIPAFSSEYAVLSIFGLCNPLFLLAHLTLPPPLYLRGPFLLGILRWVLYECAAVHLQTRTTICKLRDSTGGIRRDSALDATTIGNIWRIGAFFTPGIPCASSFRGSDLKMRLAKKNPSYGACSVHWKPGVGPLPPAFRPFLYMLTEIRSNRKAVKRISPPMHIRIRKCTVGEDSAQAEDSGSPLELCLEGGAVGYLSKSSAVLRLTFTRIILRGHHDSTPIC